jgi:hypothetical protein
VSVFEHQDAPVAAMTMHEFVHFCVTPADAHVELASRLLATRETAARVADRLAALPNDPRFPIRSTAGTKGKAVAAVAETPTETDDTALVEGLLDRAATFGFQRTGASVFERKDAPVAAMTMHEFVYFCVMPAYAHVALASRLFATQATASRIADRLAALPNDPRFPIC